MAEESDVELRPLPQVRQKYVHMWKGLSHDIY